METRAHHVLIGLFTLLAAGAILLFTLWLGKTDSDRKYEHYDIAFREAVSGLSRGSKVEFNGIKIGEVTALRLDPEDPQRVFARVRVDNSAPIRTDTRARLVMAGITGTSFIRLSSGRDPASQPLRSTGDAVPVIAATPSALNKLLSDGGESALNIGELVNQLRTIVSAENAESLRLTLKHVEQASGAIAARRDDLGRAVQQLAVASERSNAALAEATRLMGSTSRLIEEQGKPTLEGAQRSLAALEQTLAATEQLIRDNRGHLDSGLRGAAEIGPTLAELRATLASLRTISRRLEDRPADFLLGLEPIKEFQP
ncbi:MAG: hypothetical protein RJA36_2015 [Pseudomonadota bacterium]|jgi:phospholipid/cholesterol/gamma-HCH transport system substrate-binding protein